MDGGLFHVGGELGVSGGRWVDGCSGWWALERWVEWADVRGGGRWVDGQGEWMWVVSIGRWAVRVDVGGGHWVDGRDGWWVLGRCVGRGVWVVGIEWMGGGETLIYVLNIHKQ